MSEIRAIADLAGELVDRIEAYAEKCGDPVLSDSLSGPSVAIADAQFELSRLAREVRA